MISKKPLIIGVTLAVLVSGVSLSVFALTNTSGPSVAALLPNAPSYICPEGMPASDCAQLKLTCGNGVVDPGEDCKNCAFDAGCPSGLVCGNISGGDEYTCHYPAGLCLAGPAG
jgi:hypothetical protein